MFTDIMTIKYVCAVVIAVLVGLSTTSCNGAPAKQARNHTHQTAKNPPRLHDSNKTSTETAICDRITAESLKIGLDPVLPLAVAKIESAYRPYARSHAGAIGVFQIMPANAKRCGTAPQYLHGVDTNIKCGVQIIQEELDVYDGDIYRMLRAYNGGPKCVKAKCRESEQYVQKIIALISTKHRELAC